MLEAGFVSGGIDDVTVAHIRFEVTGGDDADRGMIAAGAVAGFTLEGCELVMAPAPGLPGMPLISTAGVFLEGVQGSVIDGNELERLVIGIWGLGSTRLEVSRNHLRGPFQQDPAKGVVLAAGEFGALITAAGLSPHRIEHNRIENYAVGVFLVSGFGSEAKHHLILGNEITRTGVVPSEDGPRFAIDVQADHCTVAGNTMNLPSGLCGGIRVAGLHALIEDNHVDSTASQNDPEVPIGILLGPQRGFPADSGVIRGNRLTGRQNAIWVEQAGNVEVAGNHIEDVEGRLEFAFLLLNAEAARVEGNYIFGSQWGIVALGGSNNRLTGNVLRAGRTGLSAVSERSLDVDHNRVESMSLWGFAGLGLSDTVSLSHNHFISCSYEGVSGGDSAAASVIVVLASGEVRIESCEVLNTGIPLTGGTFHRPAYGILGLWLRNCLVHGNLVSYTHLPGEAPMEDLNREDRALVLHGVSRFIEVEIPSQVSPIFRRRFVLDSCAQVVDNRFVGPGFNALVDFLVTPRQPDGFDSFERVIFNNNHCLHYVLQDSDPKRATIQIRNAAAIVMGNQFQAFQPEYAPVNFNNTERQQIFLGNIHEPHGAIGFNEFPNFTSGQLPARSRFFNLTK